MTAYSLHGALRFELKGTGALLDYLKMQYAEFESAIDGDADLLVCIEASRRREAASIRLTGDGENYSRSEGDFVWVTPSGQVSLDGTGRLADVGEMVVDAGFPRMALNRLLEYRFRLAMRDVDAVLVHACCLASGSSGLLLPAWKATGKTSLALTLLARGYGFLSDDRVWLRRSGELLCYPRYLVINASNAREFSDLLDLRSLWAHGINRALKRRKGLPRIATQIMRRLVPPPIRYFKLAELFAEAETPRSVSLRNAFFVTRPGASKVVWDELSTSEMAKLVGAVADFEWNAELMLIVGAHDVLFPEGPCWRAELGELMQADAEVLGVAFAAADCAHLLLPADVDWAMATDALEARVKA